MIQNGKPNDTLSSSYCLCILFWYMCYGFTIKYKYRLNLKERNSICGAPYWILYNIILLSFCYSIFLGCVLLSICYPGESLFVIHNTKIREQKAKWECRKSIFTDILYLIPVLSFLVITEYSHHWWALKNTSTACVLSCSDLVIL